MWMFSNKNSVNTTGIKQQLKICVWLNVMLVIVSVGKGGSEGGENGKIKSRTLSDLKQI